MSEPLAAMAVGSAAAGQPPPYILAAMITGGAAIIAALIAASGSKRKDDSPAQPQPRYHAINIYQPDNSLYGTNISRHSRAGGGSRPVLLIVFAGAALVALFLWLDRNSTEAEASRSRSSGTGINATSTPTPTPSTAMQAQDFLRAYYEAREALRRADILEDYWTFPADFYNAKQLPDSKALIKVLPRPTTKRTCYFGVPQVVRLRDDGRELVVTTLVPWDKPGSGTSGSVTVVYTLKWVQDGHPFRIRSVSEPPNQPSVC